CGRLPESFGDEEGGIDGGFELAWRIAPIFEGYDVCLLMDLGAEAADSERAFGEERGEVDLCGEAECCAGGGGAAGPGRVAVGGKASAQLEACGGWDAV